MRAVPVRDLKKNYWTKKTSRRKKSSRPARRGASFDAALKLQKSKSSPEAFESLEKRMTQESEVAPQLLCSILSSGSNHTVVSSPHNTPWKI